jgi:hypothetical protein
MPIEGLSPAVKGFIRGHIQSVEQIEILSVMRKEPHREWTAHAIDQVLRSSERSIAERLAGFARAGLLVESGDAEKTYRCEPRDPALEAAAAETVEAYRARPVLVIETIFKPDDPAQSFADAFRLRPR